jgi:hypothetical protein
VDIEYRKEGRKWIVEVWSSDEETGPNFTVIKGPGSEALYQEINEWCINTLKYHARTAYHVFEFKKKKDLEWFLLRWS